MTNLMQLYKFRFVLLLALLFLTTNLPSLLRAEELMSLSPDTPSLSQLTVTEPDGVNDKIAEGIDFATYVLGDPWDMDEPTDLMPNGPMNMSDKGFRDVTFSNGIFRGTTTSNDSYFWLHHQGYPLANNVNPHSGLVNPINANEYKVLAFRMYHGDGDADVPIRVYWYKAGDEATGIPTGVSRMIVSKAGWNVYMIYLGNPANVAQGSWSGQVTGLRIDPTSTSNTGYKNKEVRIDWVRLLKPGTAQRDTSGSYNITWTSGLAGGSKAALSIGLDNDNNATNGVIQTLDGGIVSQANGSYTLNNPILPPGNYYVHANLGVDYAGVIRSDPWDFASAGDYVRLENFGAPSLTRGIFDATSQTNDPQIWVAIDPDKPINTNVFNRLIVRIYVSKLSFLNALWTRKDDSGPWQSFSQFVTLQPGWQTVEIDLSNASNVSTGQWSGLVTDLRIDPVTEAGVNVQIDYIGLTAGASVSSESELFPVRGTSPGVLRINQAPIIKVTAPSMTSGDDYATTILGNPWDFNSAADLARTEEVQNLSYGANGLSGQTIGGLHTGCLNDCGDPQLWLKISDDPEKYIDTERFKYVTFQYWQEGVQNLTGSQGGWATRLLWTPSTFPNDASTLDDIVVVDSWPSYTEATGWQTYQFDLRKLTLEPEVADGNNNWGWNNSKGWIAQFRLDPTENVDPTTFHLRQILLTADPVAVGDYSISWEIINADDQVTINVYYDTQKAGRARTLIGTVNQPTNSIVWDTSAVPAGTYYIYVEANDGYNSYGVYGNAPVSVRQQASIDLQKPDSNGSWVKRGQEFSQDVFGNAWDMDSAADIDSRVMGDITTPTFANSEMNFSSTGVDSHFWLSWDNARPIDAATYSTLCFRMYTSQASQWEAFWYDQNEVAYNSGLQLVLPGWQTYRLDMSQFAQWTGSLKRLRLDPLFSSGIDAKIDWVKLIKSQSATYQVTWATQNTDGATVDIYAAPARSTANSVRLAQGLLPSASPYTLDVSCLANGEYYLYAELKGANVQTVRSFSDGKLVISETGAPQLVISTNALNFLLTPNQTKSFKVGISTTGGSYAWSLNSGYEKTWLAVTPRSGSALPAEITLTADARKLPSGQTDSTTVTVNAPGVGSQNIQVTLRVASKVYNLNLPLLLR